MGALAGKLGDKLDAEMAALGKEHTQIENFTSFFGKCLIVFDKFPWGEEI